MSDNNQPSAKLVDSEIQITVKLHVLEFATNHNPEFWDPELNKQSITVVDVEKFAQEVIDRLNDGCTEDGSTLITRMLDAAILSAIENGCEGTQESPTPTTRAGGGNHG